MRRSALILAALVFTSGTAQAAVRDVSIFFYPWYGTPSRDGSYRHWDQDGHLPPADLASTYYPARGPYSSGDPAVLRRQMAEIAAAGIGEVVSSWWGWGSLEDVRLPAVMRAARARGLRVAVQIEPYPGRTAATVEADIGHLRELGVSRFYVFRPFEIPEADWAALNDRTTGVQVFAQTGNVTRAVAGRFRGVYTYDIVTYTSKTFARLCAKARAAGLICAPSVGPGYEAERATGDARRRPRRDGVTYDSMWAAAIEAGAERITITSYNEWHEGTQIEPARTPAPRRPAAMPVERAYESYDGAYGLRGRAAETAYLGRTRLWSSVFGLLRRAARTLQAASQPLTTPSGTSRATRRARPARSTISTTRSTSLYANGASSASPLGEGHLTTIPRPSSSLRSSLPPIRLRAAVRDSIRPAPWHVVPNERDMEPSLPAST